jgi:hypothetical protein
VEQEQALGDKLRQYRPDQVLPLASCHGTGQFWTVEAVKSVVEQWYGVTYRYASSYRSLLHRGGLSTKIHVKVDGWGCPLRLHLTAGQHHDIIIAQDFLDAILASGAEPGIPPRNMPKHPTVMRRGA